MYLQAAELCEQAVLEAEEWQQVTDWLRVIRVDSRVLDAGVCVLLCMCAVVCLLRVTIVVAAECGLVWLASVLECELVVEYG